MTEGRFASAPGAATAPAPERSHVGLQPGFVEKDEAARIKFRLVGFPPHPSSGDVRTILFGAQQGFF